MKKALKDLKNDDSYDLKTDDKSGSFVLANRDDYISAAKLDLTKQGNISELNQEVDKKEIIEKVEVEVAIVVDDMVRRGEMKETTGDFI